MLRLCWFVVVVLAAGVLAGCSQQKDVPSDASTKPDAAKSTKNSGTAKPGPRTDLIQGYYVHDDPALRDRNPMSDMRPTTIMRLAAKDGRWMMMDALIGYGGTYVETESGAVFTTTKGPAGSMKEPEEITVTTTSKGIKLTMPGGGSEAEFAWKSDAIPEEFDFDAFLGKKMK